jgi:hypothetical protein
MNIKIDISGRRQMYLIDPLVKCFYPLLFKHHFTFCLRFILIYVETKIVKVLT